MNPLIYIVGTALLISAFGNSIQIFKIKRLNSDVQELELELTEANINYATLNNVLLDQNKAISLLRVDLKLKDNKLTEWKNKPEKIRYNVIYKKIPEYIDVKKEDCETTKDVITAIRSITFN